MAENFNLSKLNIGGHLYDLSAWGALGISLQYFATLLSRDEYCPVADKQPTEKDTTYIDPASGNPAGFHAGQCVVYPDKEMPDKIGLSIAKKVEYDNGNPVKVYWLHLTDSIKKLGETERFQEITYDDLVELRNESKLLPGGLYRIIDYVTTVANTPEARSAGHPFDIIVLATSSNKLAEEAMAIQSNRDKGYFDGCKLEAWKLWYCLDNEINRFQWADPDNGKGVIYRMIDEWGNDCPYDFKNVQFKRYAINELSVDGDQDSALLNDRLFFIFKNWSGFNMDIDIDYNNYRYYYTFSGISNTDEPDNITDISILIISSSFVEEIGVKNNRIGPKLDNKDYIFSLNDIVFISQYSNTKHPLIYENYFGNNCSQMTLGPDSRNNKFGKNCKYNTLYSFWDNIVGDNFKDNVAESQISHNTFGNSCGSNLIRQRCTNNTFGDLFEQNIIKKGFSSCVVGIYCIQNIFLGNIAYCSIGNLVQNTQINSIPSMTRILDAVGHDNVESKLQIKINAPENGGIIFIGQDSNGALRSWNPADLVPKDGECLCSVYEENPYDLAMLSLQKMELVVINNAGADMTEGVKELLGEDLFNELASTSVATLNSKVQLPSTDSITKLEVAKENYYKRKEQKAKMEALKLSLKSQKKSTDVEQNKSE